MNYHAKYIKYKIKYLELKKNVEIKENLNGGNISENTIIPKISATNNYNFSHLNNSRILGVKRCML
jgi:hypothetical protein